MWRLNSRLDFGLLKHWNQREAEFRGRKIGLIKNYDALLPLNSLKSRNFHDGDTQISLNQENTHGRNCVRLMLVDEKSLVIGAGIACFRKE